MSCTDYEDDHGIAKYGSECSNKVDWCQTGHYHWIVGRERRACVFSMRTRELTKSVTNKKKTKAKPIREIN